MFKLNNSHSSQQRAKVEVSRWMYVSFVSPTVQKLCTEFFFFLIVQTTTIIMGQDKHAECEKQQKPDTQNKLNKVKRE